MSNKYLNYEGLQTLVTSVKTNFVPNSSKGVANGVATLDNSGKVPSSQLPSYVDDVIEYASQSDFPTTGESGKIYIALDTNKTYRWSGTNYTEISASLALGETSSTAYAGDKGKQNATNIATLQSDLGNLSSSLEDVILNLDTKVTQESGKGLSTNDYTTAEKNKLSGIAEGAEVNVQSDWNVTDTTSDAYIKNKPNVITKTSGASAKFVKGDGSLDDSTYLKTITATSGTNINAVGTPTVTATTTGNATTLTFNYLKGVQGYQGYQGKSGVDGAQGVQGTTGLQGTTGSTGSRGYQGYRGYQGATGSVTSVQVTGTGNAITDITGTTELIATKGATFLTKVSTGAGLTGGDITTTGTIKANLKSETSLGTIDTTSKLYAVGVDSQNRLCVQVPWSDTTYTSKTADSGGTEVSLVTTGEKYTWNNKQSAISDLDTIRSNATNGNTAYGWGNHANAGYLKSSDMVAITTTEIDNLFTGW